MVKKVWTIAKVEWRQTVMAKGFILAVLLTPMLAFGSLLVQKFIRERADTVDRKVAVVDEDGRVFPLLARAAEERNTKEIFVEAAGVKRQVAPRYVFERVRPGPGGDLPAELSNRVRSGDIFAYLVVDPGTVEGRDGRRVTYHAQTHTYTELPRWLHDALTGILRRLRLEGTSLSPETAEKLLAPTPLKWRGLVKVDDRGKRIDAPKINLYATFAVPAGAMMLMFVIVFISVPMLLHSVIEEKQQRIWEVLVSSVNPFQLLLGKLLGAVMVSMMLSMLYLGGTVAFAEVMGVSDEVPGSLYAWFLLFQLLALLIYGSMFSAIGAACSELRDAQSLMVPAMFVIIVPMFGWVAILRAPDSPFAIGLSLFPPATPMLMLLRMALPPGPAPWEIGLGILLTSAFTLACVWAAGKIFRVGILAQGQTPTIRRLISWVLAK
jgi:ABC-2 type transport system permease protein